MTSIGILGGTGKQGSALAKRCIQANYEVRIGSRSSDRGRDHAENLNKDMQVETVIGGNNEFASKADVVALAIPFDQVEPLIEPLKANLEGKIILDMTVNLEFGKYIITHLHDGKSSYEFIRDYLPKSQVVACLKTISYSILHSLEPIHQTDFQMTTDDESFNFSSELVKNFGLTPVRVRGRVHAHTIERMVALSIQLNKEYKGSHVGYILADLNLG